MLKKFFKNRFGRVTFLCFLVLALFRIFSIILEQFHSYINNGLNILLFLLLLITLILSLAFSKIRSQFKVPIVFFAIAFCSYAFGNFAANNYNFGLGSNSEFYNTLTNCPSSTWISADPNIVLEVDSEGHTSGELTRDGKIREMIMVGDYGLHFIPKEISKPVLDSDCLLDGSCDYTKRNGKVVKFIVTVGNDKAYHGKYKTITFLPKK